VGGLRPAAPPEKARSRKRIAIAAAVLLAAGGGAYGYRIWVANDATVYLTAKVERGDLLVTVTSTGTVQPVTQVEVGTQVSGTVQRLDADFNSRVKAGEIVAQIDPASFKASVDQDRANLLRAQADVERVKASLVQAGKDLARSKELARRDLISVADLDVAIAAYDSLVAQLKVAEATVIQSKATLRISEVSLGYTRIVSPIDGLVISRNVDVGQTVAASLQAPTIFIIADSLRKIQIQASVSEADIGKIVSGQDVSFTVDAWREKPFSGKVSQIRLSPTTVQNVVTYTVLIDADNPEEKLLPGMTASVAFQVARHTAVLKIPNAALRFIPPDEFLVDTVPDNDKDREPLKGGGRARTAGTGRVWIRVGTGLKAVPLMTVPGATDGSFTLLKSGEVQEGQEVVTGIVSSDSEPAIASLFSPQPRSGGR
jgi:HlyD family secretion protein